MNPTLSLMNFIYSSTVFVLCLISTRANLDVNSLIRIRLKAIHFENNEANLQRSTTKYETSDEDLQHLIKLMKENPMKTSLDLTFNYEKFYRKDFNPRKMLIKVCKEFQGTRIQPITNTLFLVNDDGDEVDRKNTDIGLEFILYLSSIMKIPVITWFPDRSGQMENYANSMALRLEPMNWHIAQSFVDFMQAYNWDLVTLVISTKQRENKSFLKEFKNIQKERSNIENHNYFPFTISDVHIFEGLESDELHNCIVMMHRCRTIKSILVALEKIFKNNDRIILFLGNKAELVTLIAAVRKSNGPKRYLKKLLGRGYLWISAPSFMNPIETSERSNSIQLDNMVIQNWLSKEGMQVSGMFFLACLNHYSVYKKKAEFVRKLWQKSLLKLIQQIKDRFSTNSTDLMNKIIPKEICNRNESVWKWGQRLYQIMKSETVEFHDEFIGFHSNGAVNTTELFIFNSKIVQGRMKWFKVGKWSMSSKWGKKKSKIRIDGVTWPGGENKPPKGRPDKVKLRVATMQEMPFVFYGRRQENGKCDANAIPCRILQKIPDDSHANKAYEDDEEEVTYKKQDTTSSFNSSGKFPIYVPSCCAGLTMDLLNELMKDLNFVVDLFEVPDGKWGGWTPQGWNGLIKVLLDGEADLVMTSLKITTNRSEQIDFSAPFMETGIAIIVALRKGAISPTAFLEPYDYPSWCLILVFSVHACGAALFIYEWLSPHGLDRGNIQMTDHKFSLVRSLWLIWSMLFGAAVNTDNPRGVASRFLANIWALFALVFLASYTANLAAFMIAKDDFYDLSGIKDWRLMNPHTHKPTFRFSTVPSGATEENVKINFPKMFSYMQNFNKTTVDDGIKALKSGEIDAFIYDSNVLDYKAAKDKKCKLKTVGNLYAMTGYGVGFPKGSKWRQKINDLILQYQRYGKLQRAKRFWMTGQCKKQRTLDSTNKRLGVTNFISAFILLLAGMLLCSIILFLEHLFFRYLRLKVRKTDRYGCCQLVSISLSQIMNYDQTVNKSLDTMKSSLCSTNPNNSCQSKLRQENDLLKQKIQKLEIALSYMTGCEEFHRSTKNCLTITKKATDVSISLSNYLTLPHRKNHDETELNHTNKAETTNQPPVLYRCEDQEDISIYCPKHIELYNQKHSRRHSFYTVPKFPISDRVQHNYSNSVKTIQKYPSCNNVSSQSKTSKSLQNSTGKYKIIKSISPNNFYKFSNSSFSSFLLKGKRKKNEMLVKESCL